MFGKHIRKTRTQVDLYTLDCIQNDKPKLSVEGIEGPNLVEGSPCLEAVVILETEYMPVAGEPIISNISQMRNQRCSVSIHSALLYEEISLLIKCEERLLVFQGINSSISRYGKTRQCASLRGRAGLLSIVYHIYQPLNQDRTASAICGQLPLSPYARYSQCLLQVAYLLLQLSQSILIADVV